MNLTRLFISLFGFLTYLLATTLTLTSASPIVTLTDANFEHQTQASMTHNPYTADKPGGCRRRGRRPIVREPPAAVRDPGIVGKGICVCVGVI